MLKYYSKRKKAVAAAMSAMLVASAFQPAGCNVTIDPSVLSQIVETLAGSEGLSGGSGFGPGFGSEFDPVFGTFSGDWEEHFGEDCFDGEWDDHGWEDGPNDDEV